MKFSAAVVLFGVVANALPQAEVVPRAAATYQATVGSYKHVACQTDPNTNARTLTGKSTSSSSMTPATCMTFCSGYKYFGVEWGVQCFCGNSLASTSSAVAQSQCNKACSGSSALTCGAGNRLDLYMLVTTTSTSRSSTSTTSRSSTSITTSRSTTSSTTSRSSTSSTTTRSTTTTTTSRSSTSTTSTSRSSTSTPTTSRSSTSTTSTSSSTTSTITTISSTVYPAIAAPSPTASGTTKSCGKWYTILSTDTCASIESAWAISFDALRVMNPYINNQCDNLIVGDSLCVIAANAPSASTSTTSSARPTPTANNGKRGLCYNDPSLTSSFVGPNSQVSWGYNWGSWIDPSFPTAYEYVPMLWSDNVNLTSIWFQNVELALERGTTHLLSFNEPDLGSQANMTPKAAADAYMTWMQPFAGRAKLGAPAITNGDPTIGMGLGWMAQFMGNCTACTIDFVPIHWYDQASNYYYFKAYMQSVYAQVQKPVWITEFNGAGSQDDQSAFLKLVMPWLDSLSYIQRYAWFWAADGYLLSTGTTLSETGVTFNNYTSSTINPYFTS